jgi:hypothetical protein
MIWVCGLCSEDGKGAQRSLQSKQKLRKLDDVSDRRVKHG